MINLQNFINHQKQFEHEKITCKDCIYYFKCKPNDIDELCKGRRT